MAASLCQTKSPIYKVVIPTSRAPLRNETISGIQTPSIFYFRCPVDLAADSEWRYARSINGRMRGNPQWAWKGSTISSAKAKDSSANRFLEILGSQIAPLRF